ncbi:KTSC domain-containing protein [Myxococcus sp. SDU36]|uniref:KTSC domain-containing protein n=1 Tax=Myxococcus sp. SDU36 TaxID=2831967 RepID=UPI0027A5FEAF|nr:KTSC domain-containing protein [Myxococcus sp. SDU36]
MKREPVESSNISSIGYDAPTQTLEVEFHDRSVYQYDQVPAAIHASLLAAASKGSYFASHIKGVFAFNRIC